MKKTAWLLLVFLCSGLFASSVYAAIKKEDFVTLSFPQGITLDVPRSWKIVTHKDQQQTTYLELSEIQAPRMSFDESILMEINGENNTVILDKFVAAKFEPAFAPKYMTAFYLGYVVPDSAGPGQAEVADMTNLREVGNIWFNEMRESHAPNFILSDWSGLSKVMISDFICLHFTMKVQHIDKDSPAEAEYFVFYLNENSFTIAIYSYNDDKLRARPEVQRILGSVRIEQ